MSEANEATPLTYSSIEIPEITLENFIELFGIPLHDGYKLAIKYYRETEKSGELQVEYSIRLRFMAYSKQAKYGTFNENVADVGWFDLVGNDAKREWKKLGDLSQDQAMLEFVRLLDVVCPAFKPHIQEKIAIENSKQSIDLIQNGANPVATSNYSHLINGGLDSKEVIEKYQQQRQQIQEALNKQTYHQFLAYAQQTHPGEPQKQAELIANLQAEHFAQYMSQVYAAQQAQAEADARGNDESSSDSEAGQKPKDSYMQEGLERPRSKGELEDSTEVSDEGEEHLPSNPKIAPASLWNRKEIQEFKGAIKKEGPDGVLKIGHGETVTVRVPTHEEGTCLFWEFATDYYDIGFGVYFEWTVSETNQVSVIVSESDDEEYENEEEAEVSGASGGANDLESAATARHKPRDPNKPLIDEIIPVYRRDSHEEVYAGSHVYPGRGVYLLKFDNSYSLWRSKTLYYRVYYSK